MMFMANQPVIAGAKANEGNPAAEYDIDGVEEEEVIFDFKNA